MSNEKFSEIKWSKEFGKGKLNVKVNKALISELTSSINCGYNQLCRIIDESSNYLSKDSPNANYSKIRKTADFLGVPPWIIFSDEGNENIKSLYENATTSVFNTYTISSIGESLEKVKKGLSRAMLTKNKRDELDAYLEEIKEVLTKNGEHIENSWRQIFKFLTEEFKKDNVDWGCHISINNGSFNGTLRITKWLEGKGNKAKSWSSAWFYYKEIDNNQPYQDELLVILNDITKLIGKQFWQFSVLSSSNSEANLFSWHSDRVNIFDDKQYKKIAENLPLSPNFMASPEPVICLMPNFNFNEGKYTKNDVGDISELINWLEDTENTEASSSTSTRINYLKILFDNNYLKENDRLIYKYENDFKNDNNKAVCILVNYNGELRVKWGYDDNIYSISSLSKKLLLECDRISHSTNPDGNKYWRLEDSNATSLYDVAVNIKQDNESDQIKLF